MSIEIGSNGLTIERLLDVVYSKTLLVFDNTVAGNFSSLANSGKDVAFAPVYPERRASINNINADNKDVSRKINGILLRASAACMLSQLVLTPSCVSFEFIDTLKNCLNDDNLPYQAFYALCNNFDSIEGLLSAAKGAEFAYISCAIHKLLCDHIASHLPKLATNDFTKENATLTVILPSFALALEALSSGLVSLMAPLTEVAYGLFLELICGPCKDILQATNYTVHRRAPGQKVSSENVRSLIGGSKKAQAKRAPSREFSIAYGDARVFGEVRDVASALRLAARMDLLSCAYGPDNISAAPQLGSDLLTCSGAILGAVDVASVVASQSSARLNLLNRVIISEVGQWKPISDSAYEFNADAKDGEAAMSTGVKALNTLQVALEALYNEISFAITTLRDAATRIKKGKVQVGQGCLELVYSENLLQDQQKQKEDGCNFWNTITQSRALINVALERCFNVGTTRRIPQPACGTRDLLPAQTLVRERALATIKSIFRKHGAVNIETPVFEHRDVLLGKYGEDQKLIYHLADFGEEALCLRYDLTVPFARYCASHKIQNIKRFQIGRVYRRDKPVMERGRFREFYQCDFDCAVDPASSCPMLPDAEVLIVIDEILSTLGIGQYEVLVNHRGILDAVMQLAGVPKDKFRSICACIDSLDKTPEEEVRERMIVQRGLEPAVADRVLQLIKVCGSPFETIDNLADPQSPVHELYLAAQPLFEEMHRLFRYVDLMSKGTALPRFRFDLSLARGLDYYTGVIFEAKMLKIDPITGQYIRSSSIAGGGRYDHLLGMFRAPGEELPAVGGSVGIERIFAILENNSNSNTADNATDKTTGENEENLVKSTNNGKDVDVYICAAIGGNVDSRLKIAADLWAEGIKVGLTQKEGGSLKSVKKDLAEAVESNAKLAIIVGADEIERNVANIKTLATSESIEVPSSELVATVKKLLASERPDFALEHVLAYMRKAVASGSVDIEEMRLIVESFDFKHKM